MDTGGPCLRITTVPDGEAPLAVREKWVGLSLPLLPASARPRKVRTFGVLTGPRHPLARIAALVLGRTQPARGYVVDASRALELLQQESPEAAAWWRTSAPHMLQRGRCFLFPEDCGHVMASLE